jgi:hypothetical protein
MLPQTSTTCSAYTTQYIRRARTLKRAQRSPQFRHPVIPAVDPGQETCYKWALKQPAKHKQRLPLDAHKFNESFKYNLACGTAHQLS